MLVAPRAWARVLGLAILAGALCGCSSKSTGGSSPAASGDAAHFVDQLADELCAAVEQCCPATGHATPSDCATSARLQLHADVDAEIAAGIGVNTDAANKCLAAYHSLAPSCPAVWDKAPFQACKQSLAGTSPPGGPCEPGCAPSNEGSVVCVSSVTVGPDGGTVATPRTCQVEITGPPGSMCDIDLASKPIVHQCDSAAGSFCQNGMCTAPATMGSPCSGNNCVAAAYCHNGTCEPRIATGAACSGSGSECVAGSSCDPVTLTCKAGDSWKKLCAGDYN